MEDMKVAASAYDFSPAHAAMRRFVDGNILSGVSSAVLAGRDLVDVNCVGWADKEAQIPLRVDHIFRVFSNTKLITSCAALLLFEEGRFQLDDPIERFIPQLANRRVLRPGATSLDEAEAADKSITIRHLMSHSSGLSYGEFDPGTLIFRAYNERKVLNPATTLTEMIDVIAGLPLVYHPGTSWEYSVAHGRSRSRLKLWKCGSRMTSGVPWRPPEQGTLKPVSCYRRRSSSSLRSKSASLRWPNGFPSFPCSANFQEAAVYWLMGRI